MISGGAAGPTSRKSEIFVKFYLSRPGYCTLKSRKIFLFCPSCAAPTRISTAFMMDPCRRSELSSLHKEALEPLRNISGSCPKADLIASHPLRQQTIFAVVLVWPMDPEIEFPYHVVCFSDIFLHYPRMPSTLDAPRTLLVTS